MTVNGTVKLSVFLDFVKLFKGEHDKNVWTVILSALLYIDRVFDKDRAKISSYTGDLLSSAYQRLGWESPTGNEVKDGKAGEDALTKQLSGLILGTLGTIGQEKSVVAQAKERYAKHLNGSAALEPDVLGAVITILAYDGDQDRYNEFEKMFGGATSPQDQDRYMYALATFRDEKLLQRTLAKTLNGEIKSQSAPFVVRSVMLNPGAAMSAGSLSKIIGKRPGLFSPARSSHA